MFRRNKKKKENKRIWGRLCRKYVQKWWQIYKIVHIPRRITSSESQNHLIFASSKQDHQTDVVKHYLNWNTVYTHLNQFHGKLSKLKRGNNPIFHRVGIICKETKTIRIWLLNKNFSFFLTEIRSSDNAFNKNKQVRIKIKVEGRKKK